MYGNILQILPSIPNASNLGKYAIPLLNVNSAENKRAAKAILNGFQFPNNNISTNHITVDGYNIQDEYINLGENGIEDNQNKPTIIVFDNANNILESVGGFGVNVDPSTAYVEPDTLDILISITPNIYVIGDIDLINFNPFLIVNEIRGKEVHLADYPPTNLADESYFGTMNDDSNPATGKYYKTENNLPWAINITQSYDYTIEKSQITQGYLKFYDWAASSGTTFQNWYQDWSLPWLPLQLIVQWSHQVRSFLRSDRNGP